MFIPSIPVTNPEIHILYSRSSHIYIYVYIYIYIDTHTHTYLPEPQLKACKPNSRLHIMFDSPSCWREEGVRAQRRQARQERNHRTASGPHDYV